MVQQQDKPASQPDGPIELNYASPPAPVWICCQTASIGFYLGGLALTIPCPLLLFFLACRSRESEVVLDFVLWGTVMILALGAFVCGVTGIVLIAVSRHQKFGYWRAIGGCLLALLALMFWYRVF